MGNGARTLCVAALGLLGWPAVEPFPREVAEGTTLRRTFESESTLELVELDLLLDGEPHPPGQLGGGELRQTQRCVIEDDFGPPAVGRPRRLVRYFEELGERSVRSLTGLDGSSEEERARTSDLEGRSVSFALGFDDDGEYVVDWEDHAGEDELLVGLVEDLDLRAFLPAATDVDEGFTWDVPARAYLLLARPGGVEFVAGADDETDRRRAAELRDNLTGEIEAVFMGRREVDGVTVAVVALEISLVSEASTPVPTDDEASVRVNLRQVHELQGELCWDSAGGHLHTLELGGRVELEERTTIALGEHESVQRARYVGVFEQTVRVEVAE